MIIRLLLATILGIFIALYEVGAVPFLPVWAGLHPVIPCIVLALVSSSKSRAFAFAIGAAFVLDAYTLDYFDLALLRLPFTVFFLGWIADRFLTNRSVYASVALVICGRLMSWLGTWLVSFFAVLFSFNDTLWIMPPAPLFILIWDAAATALGFLLLASFTGRFILRPHTPYATR